MKIRSGVLLLMLATVSATAQTKGSPVAALKFPPLRQVEIPKVDTYTLPNGMQLLLLENHELPLIRGVALVRTGNLFDPADKVGLATVTGEVLRSGGTKAKTGDQLDEQLENIAASVETGIGESSGTVSFSALKESTDDVLGVFHDVLTDPAFREDKVEFSKSQLKSGISRRNDDAQGIAGREFASLIYGKNNSYGWDMEYATVDHIQRADVVNFYQRYFFPANTMLAVTGDFSAPEMRSKIEKLFSAWTVQQSKVPSFPLVNHQPVPGTYVAVKPDVTQTTFVLGQLGGQLNDKDYPALEVMADILGGGFRSRLFQTVRTKLGYAYNISADWGANYDHPGIFEISGSTKSASTTESLQVIEQELQKIRTTEVTAGELEAAKQSVLNSFAFFFDTPSKTLNRLLTYKYYGYPDDFLFQYQKALLAVTRADILRVAKERIDPQKLVILAVGNPKDFKQPLSVLGSPVKTLDIAIPEPSKAEAAKGTAVGNEASLAAGRQLLAKMQEAAGGAAKLSTVHDLSQKAQMQVSSVMGGMKVEQWNRWIAPSTFRQDAQYPFGKVSVFFQNDAGWIVTPQGQMALPDPQKKQLLGELFRLYVPLLLSDRVTDRKVNLLSSGVLEISGAGNQSVQLTVDPKTSLPQKVEYQSAQPQGGSVTVTNEFGAFQTVQGIQMPSRITVLQNGQKFAEVTVAEMEINTGIKAETLSQLPEKKK